MSGNEPTQHQYRAPTQGAQGGGYQQPPGYTQPDRQFWPTQPPPQHRPSTGMSTAALVLGILGALTGLIPLLFFIAIPLGTIALILGLVAYSRGKRIGVAMGRAGSILGGIAFVLGVIGIVIVNDALKDLDGDDEPSANVDAQEAAAEPDGEVFALGQTAHTGDFDVTVHGVTDPFVPSNQFEPQAPEGLRYVAVELTMTNTSDQPLPLSTLLGAEMTDSAGRLGTYSIAGISELPRLDSATTAPGEARRGWVVFEMPADATSLKLRVKGEITATGSLFQLTS